ncbi:sensor histidine kinase [Georgenia subflava]|uniref:histidine kinase n=1 Tax=Georgenia subflava TaxID=1622177 RepID=A0A6N7EE46_9MICO|nr:histidine kinase [Georgenia subflava]MPV36290.1 sensor histidine kinase [Georgenia subflava]
MLGTVRSALREPLAGRRLITPLAALFFLAAAVDTGRWWELALLAVPVALFGIWYVRPRFLPVLAVVTPVTVCLALWDGGLEPGVFLVSLLALTVSAWADNRVFAAVVVVACLLTPVVVDVLSPEAHIVWGIWMLGIMFPAVLGLTVRRLEHVTAELARARHELAERAVVDERQRIGRDVHDLVGHGLAAVMLHITGARHVLRRDVDAADEALRTAEEAGRASMQELRRTVELLRRDDETTGASAPGGADPPAPGLGQIPDLVATYRAAGLPVRLRSTGDLDIPDGGLDVPATVGLTAYRIAQQALANAAQHAPEAATTVTVEVTGTAVRLGFDTVGPTRAGVPGHGHGLVSMRERARVAGGALSAGPTATGWSVRCTLPLDPAADAGPAETDGWITGAGPGGQHDPAEPAAMPGEEARP